MPRRRSPDGAPAAAQRRGGTTLTPTSGNPPSGGEEGPEPKTPNPAGAAQQTPCTPAPATVALSQEAVCCDHRQNPPTLYRTSSAPSVSIVSRCVRAPVQIVAEDDHDALGQRDRFQLLDGFVGWQAARSA